MSVPPPSARGTRDADVVAALRDARDRLLKLADWGSSLGADTIGVSDRVLRHVAVTARHGLGAADAPDVVYVAAVPREATQERLEAVAAARWSHLRRVRLTDAGRGTLAIDGQDAATTLWRSNRGLLHLHRPLPDLVVEVWATRPDIVLARLAPGDELTPAWLRPQRGLDI